jgi:hypothetical protein
MRMGMDGFVAVTLLTSSGMCTVRRPARYRDDDTTNICRDAGKGLVHFATRVKRDLKL